MPGQDGHDEEEKNKEKTQKKIISEAKSRLFFPLRITDKDMKSYLRFLSRNKLYTVIMTVGLSVALAFVLLIGTYVWQQYSAARNVENWDRIYSLGEDRGNYAVTGLYLGAANDIMANIPEIEAAGSYLEGHRETIRLDGELMHIEKAVWVDKGLLDIFGAKFVAGSGDVLDDLSNAIVSESFAKANGGVENIIGRKLKFSEYEVIKNDEFTIAAVIEDFEGSLLPYSDILLNINSPYNSTRKEYRYISDTYPFVKVRKGVRQDEIVPKLEAEVKRINEEIGLFSYKGAIVVNHEELFFSDYAVSLNMANLKSLRTMLAVVILLLVSAMINFINLSTAMSSKRLKEIATRRVSGADKKEILGRYILESVGLCLVCVAAAVLIALSAEPYINNLVRSDVPINISLKPTTILVYCICAIATGIATSLIPASFGVSVDSMKVLKGEVRKENKRIFNKVFISVQSMISIILITLVITMELQMKHLIEKHVGADIEDLYFLHVGDMNRNEPLTQSIRELPFVEAVGLSEGFPGGAIEVMREVPEGIQTYGLIRCDSIAFNLYGFKKVIDKGHPMLNTVWMPQRSFDAMGLDMDSPESQWHIISADENTVFGGIVQEYAVFDALSDREDVQTFIHVYDSHNFAWNLTAGAGLLIKTTGNHKENKIAIEEANRRYIENLYGIYTEPYQTGYISDLLEDELKEEKNNKTIMELFMFLSIILSFMGLVAMSTYFSDENKGDIAIRKIYGSTTGQEAGYSIIRYMRIVLISSAAAIPLSIWLCGRYLEGFIYRIDNMWWVYVLAVGIALLISLAAISVQTLRAARTNPAEVLKKD